ncbi:hypothetical protein FBU30_003264 [Linnemannia zychae]|nr:hypothetical protein FBU30_003264 [Linnemannia zychae]
MEPVRKIVRNGEGSRGAAVAVDVVDDVDVGVDVVDVLVVVDAAVEADVNVVVNVCEDVVGIGTIESTVYHLEYTVLDDVVIDDDAVKIEKIVEVVV